MATIEELASILPNGLHDAMLVSMKVDYERGEVVLSFDADVCDPSMKKIHSIGVASYSLPACYF